MVYIGMYYVALGVLSLNTIIDAICIMFGIYPNHGRNAAIVGVLCFIIAMIFYGEITWRSVILSIIYTLTVYTVRFFYHDGVLNKVRGLKWGHIPEPVATTAFTDRLLYDLRKRNKAYPVLLKIFLLFFMFVINFLLYFAI